MPIPQKNIDGLQEYIQMEEVERHQCKKRRKNEERQQSRSKDGSKLYLHDAIEKVCIKKLWLQRSKCYETEGLNSSSIGNF